MFSGATCPDSESGSPSLCASATPSQIWKKYFQISRYMPLKGAQSRTASSTTLPVHTACIPDFQCFHQPSSIHQQHAALAALCQRTPGVHNISLLVGISFLLGCVTNGATVGGDLIPPVLQKQINSRNFMESPAQDNCAIMPERRRSEPDEIGGLGEKMVQDTKNGAD